MAVDEVYMFSYFRDPDGVDGMHLAYSLDGLSYHAVNGDVAVTMPGKGPDGTTTTIMRDPHISQGPDGIFHLTYTTSWGYNSASGKGNTTFGYTESTNLLNWTPKQNIDVMSAYTYTQNVWAPETYYDASNSRFVVLWSSEISTESGQRHIYYTTTTNFTTFAPTAKLYDPGFSVIDANINLDPASGNYVMFVKDERNGIVYKAQGGTSPTGTYATSGPYIATVGCEGPNAVKIGGTWYV